jgi:hypothetical protein
VSFKGFKEFIEEDHGRDAKSLGGDGGAQNQYGRWGQEPVHLGVHRIEDPNVLQRLNAHVGLVNTREYIDPRSALEHVQNALMRLGYHFEYNLNDMPNEQNVYPLRRFGGRQGFIDMDAEIKEDDGIEGNGEKLVLNVEFAIDPDSSRYEVMAQIVPASLFDEEEVQPDAIRPNRAGVPSTTGDADGINMGEAFPAKSKGPTRFKGDPKVKVDKVKGGFQVFVHSPRGFWIAQGQPWKTEAQAKKDAKKFNEEVNSIVYIGEAVSISMAHEKGQGTFEVEFDFRGGPTKKQAQKFALAAQKRLAGASFTPNRKGSSEKVVVTVKAGSPRDAQVKARKVLDAVKESVDHIVEAPNPVRCIRCARQFGSGSDFDQHDCPACPKKMKGESTAEYTKRLMALVNQKATNEETLDEVDLSRTFAFSTADARNRIQKLLDLASTSAVSTSDKGKGKFKFTVTGMLRGAQIDRIMNSVKQLKGQLAEEQVQVNEDISRTFAFPSADARDRVEKLLGLASREAVSKTDKGKGKFKFTVTAMLKQPQIAKIMNSVKQLKGIVEENSPTDMAHDAVRAAILERAERLHERDPFRVNQLKVARDTLKMNPVFQKVMGGPSKEEAIKILMAKGTSADKKLAKQAMNEASAFIEAGLKHARSAVGGGKQFVSVTGKMSEKKANQTIRGAAKFLKQHGTPADKKLAKKVLGEASTPGSRATFKALMKGASAIRTRNMRDAVNRVKGLKTPQEKKFGQAILDAAAKAGGAVSVKRLPDAKRFKLDAAKAKKIVNSLTLGGVINVTRSSSDPGRVAEGVQIFPAEKREFQERGSQKTRFTVEVAFTGDDWKGPLAAAVRKALKKANPKGRTTDVPRDKTIVVALVAKDAKQAQQRVSDLVADVRKKIGVKEDCDLSHDDNDKENRRTKKDNKIASSFNEAANLVTVVAIKSNKVVGQIHSIEKREIKTAIEVLKKEYPGAKVSVENKRGRIVSVEAFKEQISKRKKKAPASSSPSY